MDQPGYPIVPSTSRAPSMRGALAAAALISIALWYIPGAHLLLYPLRLFVTYIHEGGHALVTVLTGGHVEYIAIAPDTSGVTLSAGGLPGLIFMAGYVGATAFGALCLQLSRHHSGGKRGLALLGVLILGITLFWINPIGAGFFGFGGGLVMGAGLLFVAGALQERTAAFLLSFLAVQLSLNAIFDLRTLLWLTTQTNADNDAVFMAQWYGLAPWFWALLWASISGLIFAAGLRAWWRGTRS